MPPIKKFLFTAGSKKFDAVQAQTPKNPHIECEFLTRVILAQAAITQFIGPAACYALVSGPSK